MPFVNGHGGYISLFPTELDSEAETDFGSEVRIELEAWAGNWACEYVAATPAGSGGGRLLLPTIGVNTWTAVFPLDQTQAAPLLSEFIGDHTHDALVAENNGFANTFYSGMPLYAIYFRRGGELWEDLGTYYRVFDVLERTTVTSVNFLTSATDALRVVMAGMGGRLIQGHTIVVP